MKVADATGAPDGEAMLVKRWCVVFCFVVVLFFCFSFLILGPGMTMGAKCKHLSLVTVLNDANVIQSESG